MSTFERLTSLLDSQKARYTVMEHVPTGKCEEVAAIRGTEVGQGAKALVCHVKGNGLKQYVLAVLPADQQADLGKVAQAVGGLRASLASPAEVDRLTGCVFGAIPPFSFHDELKLVVDPTLCERNAEIAFNAGLLEKSMVLDVEDYQRICRFERVSIVRG